MQSLIITEKQLKIIFINMRVFRNMLGLSQEEFGKMAKVKQSEYSKIESGQKENWAKHWDDIAQAFGINPFQLLIEDVQVTLKNKQLYINGMNMEEYEKNNATFYLYQLLNAKQERKMKEDKKHLLKVTRKWKLFESKLMKANKIITQKDKTIEKLKEDIITYRNSKKINLQFGGVYY